MLLYTKRFCDSFLDAGVPGFDLAVYKDGQSVLRYCNGYSDLERKSPMKGTERYNIYSCSKVITCTAALQLWEKGLFSLEDKLCTYMPEFTNITVRTETGIQNAENPILIKQLFEMTAGFSYDCSAPSIEVCKEQTDGRCPTRELMRYLAKEPLSFEPGDRWQYSLCHDVLAALVEVISGEKFETYVRKNIFDVVGMDRSTFMLPEDELDTISQQYRFENGKAVNIGKSIPYKMGEEYASGGAGGISTVDDYMKFLEGLRTGVLLKPETVELMQTDRLTEHQKRTYGRKETHGYGLGVRCPKGDERYTDFGWGGAACAFCAIDQQNGLSIYLGMHILNSPVEHLKQYVYRFVKAELLNPDELKGLYEELRCVDNYKLPY